MAHRAPSDSGHEHFGEERETLRKKRTGGINAADASRNRRRNRGSCSLVEGREALQSGGQTVDLILV